MYNAPGGTIPPGLTNGRKGDVAHRRGRKNHGHRSQYWWHRQAEKLAAKRRKWESRKGE